MHFECSDEEICKICTPLEVTNPKAQFTPVWALRSGCRCGNCNNSRTRNHLQSNRTALARHILNGTPHASQPASQSWVLEPQGTRKVRMTMHVPCGMHFLKSACTFFVRLTRHKWMGCRAWANTGRTARTSVNRASGNIFLLQRMPKTWLVS